ncbi:hypothetical protein I553_2899 [Mycobacterium xenopi 4042]|uniref:Uncharacterized protein n=1 Tax=Mycobacterium xenopi 4042 TaxID=1299334 RepID=X8EDE5_MYCXE|nr:hypothetical protein I552_3344 [Mycobacterium xenopi 3993]EUA78609.1 hypothetical protein I553_2899 [Mycobacterium xenopi 4042]
MHRVLVVPWSIEAMNSPNCSPREAHRTQPSSNTQPHLSSTSTACAPTEGSAGRLRIRR